MSSFVSHELEHERCDVCDFDGAQFSDEQLLDALDGLGPRWVTLLESCGEFLRVRPSSEVWSALEYAAHSRDITALHVFGVNDALSGRETEFADIAADDMIAEAAARYNAEELSDVVQALAREARLLASSARDGGIENWQRAITIGAQRSSARRLLEHGLHDSTHHLIDVENGLHQIRTAS